MDEDKRKRLRAAGWKTGSAYDFLEMTDEDASYVELKILLSAAVRKLRQERHLTGSRPRPLAFRGQSKPAGGVKPAQDADDVESCPPPPLPPPLTAASPRKSPLAGVGVLGVIGP